MTSSISAVRTLLETFDTRDWAGLAAIVDENVIFEMGFPIVNDFAETDTLSAPVVGRDALIALMSGAIDPDKGTFAALRMVNIELHAVDDGEGVFGEYKSEATVRASGKPYRNVYVGRFAVRDGLVTRWKEYANPDLVRKALEG